MKVHSQRVDWISCAERLPRIAKKVDVIDKGIISQARFFGDDWVDEETKAICSFDAWKPLGSYNLGIWRPISTCYENKSFEYRRNL